MNLRKVSDIIFRERKPAGEGPYPLILMLHGWTGNEQSMGVFVPRLPESAWLVMPRGIYVSPRGGYSWFREQEEKWPWVDDFRPAMDALFELLVPENFPGIDLGSFNVAGFSQGAALAYALAFLYPQKVDAVAGLAGFLPEGCEALSRNQPLKGKHLFVSHGILDEQVPVEKARLSVKVLQEAGGEVVYCEEAVGHKLGAGCMGGLRKFFESDEPRTGTRLTLKD
jgi:phospholipase/carboxylesterase